MSEIEMLRLLSLAQHTLFADLLEPSVDDQFPENGSFVAHTVRPKSSARRRYWSYQGYRPAARPHGEARRYAWYVGPVGDAALGERVAWFNEIFRNVARDEPNFVCAACGAAIDRR